MSDRPHTYAVRGELAIGGGLARGAVVVAGERIDAVVRDPRDNDLPETVIGAAIVAPGLIDLQVNGGFGVEVGAEPAAIRHLAARLPATGVTAFLPTVISSSPEHYRRVFEAFAAARPAPGARPLGLHLEGPFLAPARAGAHRRDLIEAADDTLFASLLAGEGLRLMTLAPERPDALGCIRRLRERGVVVSLGHTDATYEEFVAGVDAGATMATHLYNAMSPFAHRAPGAIGAGLVEDRITVGLIADGVHSHPASLRLVVRAKGWHRIALVSDMMPAAGLAPGRYEFGGQPVIVDAVSAKRADGTLAGSIVTLDQAVRNAVRWTGATPAEAIAMASEVPARLLALADAGRIAVGYLADLALFDGDLNVEATIVGGEFVVDRARRGDGAGRGKDRASETDQGR
jgi:N-acetylglucosamine-6-phosphate deacetylase